MNVFFRTDASIKIGTGHVIRCLTLADALKEQGALCIFICREHKGHLIDLIKSKGYEVIGLPLEYDASVDGYDLAHAQWLGCSQLEDAKQSIEALSSRSIDWLIVDHYALDYRWESELLPFVKKILVIDDLADRKHQCHILLDQNLGKTAAQYQTLVPENCALLLGPKYALLQAPYANLHPRTPPRVAPVKSMLLYFGGSDLHDLTGMATQAFIQLGRPDIEFNIVLGSSYGYEARLQKTIQGCSNVKLYKNTPSLAPLLLQADIAIGAGGSSSWERCCLGLPALIVTLAANQIPIAHALNTDNLAKWIGNHDCVSSEIIQKALIEVLSHDDEIEAWSRRCLQITNGQGTKILSEYLLLSKDTQLQARLVTLTDEVLLLEWANDPMVRKNSFNSASITLDQHKKWFYKKLQQVEICKLYIIETQSGLPIGQVRFEFEDNKEHWRINYALAPAARHNGLGKRILETALDAMRGENHHRFFGEVLLENMASVSVFRSLDFIETKLADRFIFQIEKKQS